MRTDKMITNRPMNKLTQAKIKNIRKPIKICDGGGLWIIAESGKAKLNIKWVFRFQFFNKTRYMGLGAYPSVSLGEARENASEYRAQIRNNTDPINYRKTLKKQAEK